MNISFFLLKFILVVVKRLNFMEGSFFIGPCVVNNWLILRHMHVQ